MGMYLAGNDSPSRSQPTPTKTWHLQQWGGTWKEVIAPHLTRSQLSPTKTWRLQQWGSTWTQMRASCNTRTSQPKPGGYSNGEVPGHRWEPLVILGLPNQTWQLQQWGGTWTQMRASCFTTTSQPKPDSYSNGEVLAADKSLLLYYDIPTITWQLQQWEVPGRIW